MIPLPDHRPRLRWVAAFLLATASHVTVVAAVAALKQGADAGVGIPAIAIDLAPLVQAPQDSVADLAPGPIEQAELPVEGRTPDEPEPELEPPSTVEAKPPPEPPPPPMPSEVVTLPTERPSPVVETPHRPEPEIVRKPKPRKQRPRQASSSPRRQMQASAIAAPAPGAGNTGAAVASWQSRVAAHLNHHKRYPPAAQTRGETGTAVLLFTIDRAGNVISASLRRSSGAASLDGEASALARRASPVPAPPPEMAGSRVSLAVPIRFIAQ